MLEEGEMVSTGLTFQSAVVRLPSRFNDQPTKLVNTVPADSTPPVLTAVPRHAQRPRRYAGPALRVINVRTSRYQRYGAVRLMRTNAGGRDNAMI